MLHVSARATSNRLLPQAYDDEMGDLFGKLQTNHMAGSEIPGPWTGTFGVAVFLSFAQGSWPQ